MLTGEMPTDAETLFDFFYNDEARQWQSWKGLVPQYVHDPERKFNEILVPTLDTTRTEWLLRLQVGIKRPVLLVGETGTSKTATTANFLRSLDKESNVSTQAVSVAARCCLWSS